MRRLILGLAVAATTLVPSVVSADDTQIADFIQTRLQTEQQQGRLSGFNVDMQVEQGTVWFKGTVSNAQQEMLILQTAQKAGHLGVVQVVDDIEVTSASQAVYSQASASDAVLKPVAYQQAQKTVAPTPAAKPPMPAMPASFAMPPANDGAMMGGQVITGEPMPFATAAGEPMPMASAGMGTPSGSPNLPGYAWPGYAAHPNFGAVSYPRQYSASAWPYIGPFYPYPQVPLGWRKVSLEWDDGFWHLDFHDKSRH